MVSLKNVKGFTLVELMIVVAIIGVLATTLLPVLNGAQERARDGGRIASVNNIAAALSTYNSDTGEFPTASTAVVTATDTGNIRCLSSSAGVTASDLAKLLKGGKSPLDPQAKNRITPNGAATMISCAVDASYGYTPLQKNGVNGASFVLVADVESDKKMNYNFGVANAAITAISLGTGVGDGGNTFENWTAAAGGLNAAPSTPSLAKNNVYALFN